MYCDFKEDMYNQNWLDGSRVEIIEMVKMMMQMKRERNEMNTAQCDVERLLGNLKGIISQIFLNTYNNNMHREGVQLWEKGSLCRVKLNNPF